KTFRYVDAQGHVCAFYDTALLFPTNGINAAGPSLGVPVRDMGDPAPRVQPAPRPAEPMMTPHESLNLNQARGLLAAVCMLPATILMGASLPAIVRWIEATPGGVPLWGYLYGSNTLGAVLGDDLDAPIDPSAPMRWTNAGASFEDPSLPAGVGPLAAHVRAHPATARS
ncbi:hypothetical protein B4Q13_25425, partial [Lacticaseibacillus rhamnosus]